jgi:uncharacterized protein YndB with AHSA1/START domain
MDMRAIGLAALVAALAIGGAAARAEVVEATPNGFQVKQSEEIAAPAAKVWAALGEVCAWWNSKHSWSGDAKNLTLELKAGGCWCEANLPNGGGARHMTVLLVTPGKTAILDGTLGPLMFSGATGHLVWQLAEQDGKTTLTQTYFVGGYFPGGLGALAGPVDGVMTEQLGRLKAYVETGKPG